MAKGEIVPRGTAEAPALVQKNDMLYGTYDGITVHQDLNGSIGVGAEVDQKTLRDASRQPINEVDQKVFKFGGRFLIGTVSLTEGFVGVMAINPQVGALPAAALGTMVAIVGGVGYGITRLLPRYEGHRRAAVASLESTMTYIPSVDLRMDIPEMPDEIDTPQGLIGHDDLVTILQSMETSHLSQEAASEFRASRKTTVNPALVVKGGLLGLSEENRSRFIQNVFDHAPEMQRLATSLDRYAALSTTEAGRKGLRDQNVLLLGKLGNIASRFADLKSDEALPKVRSLVSLADDANIRAGLEEAHTVLGDQVLTLSRYNFATQNWSTEGLH